MHTELLTVFTQHRKFCHVPWISPKSPGSPPFDPRQAAERGDDGGRLVEHPAELAELLVVWPPRYIPYGLGDGFESLRSTLFLFPWLGRFGHPLGVVVLHLHQQSYASVRRPFAMNLWMSATCMETTLLPKLSFSSSVAVRAS